MIALGNVIHVHSWPTKTAWLRHKVHLSGPVSTVEKNLCAASLNDKEGRAYNTGFHKHGLSYGFSFIYL